MRIDLSPTRLLCSFVLGAGLVSLTHAAPPTIPTTLPAVAEEPGEQLSSRPEVKVRGFRFVGNTAFPSEDLSAVAGAVLREHPGGLLTAEDLEQIRTALTLRYVNAGYVNSGAVLPDQTVADGLVTFQIVEGRLSAVHVTHGRVHAMSHGASPASPVSSPGMAGMPGMDHSAMGQHGPPSAGAAPGGPGAAGEGRPRVEAGYNAQARPGQAPETPPAAEGEPGQHLLRDSYVTGRVFASAGPPLNLLELKERLELLREDPNIKSINAELKPGDVPGTSVLDLDVTERNPFQLGVSFANNRSPSVGAYRLDVLASDSDLTGNGDALSVRYGVLEGAADTLRFSRDDDFSVDYSIPFTQYDTTLLLDYTRSSDLVVETPFRDVDITSKTDSLAATVRQPFVRGPTRELAGFFTVADRYNKTFLLGQPFSFSPGAVNGKSGVFVLRFGPEYTQRSEDDALAFRGTFSVGTDGPKATIHENGQPDSRFFAFLGQFQYVRRLPLSAQVDSPLADTQGVFRLNTQLTPDPLLALEQFSLGGVDTVRGYRENAVVRDQAVNAGVELRVPVAQSGGRDLLTVIPFLDSGYGWDVRNTVQPELIGSVGVGLAFTPNDQIDARIYYGYPFKHFPHNQDDLQDMGIHFSVTMLAF